ncbi:MAG: hypothetical protein E7158_05960 [Firmicutes bacterium]|nr:hypothetical protein [Bacillota bacterium]
MERKYNVKLSDVFGIIKQMGAGEEMMSNPYFASKVNRLFNATSQFNNDKDYQYDSMEYDLESKEIILHPVAFGKFRESVAKIIVSKNSVDVVSTTKRTDDVERNFNSYYSYANIKYDDKWDLPLNITEITENISIWKDSNDEEFMNIENVSLESWYDKDGIEMKQNYKNGSTSKRKVRSGTLSEYKSYPSGFFGTSCANNINYISRRPNYDVKTSARKFADVATCYHERRENDIVKIKESFDNILYWEQLDNLWIFQPENINNRIIGPKSEEDLIEDISNIKCSDDRIKEGLKKYVAGRDKYKSKDFIRQEELDRLASENEGFKR